MILLVNGELRIAVNSRYSGHTVDMLETSFSIRNSESPYNNSKVREKKVSLTCVKQYRIHRSFEAGQDFFLTSYHLRPVAIQITDQWILH